MQIDLVEDVTALGNVLLAQMVGPDGLEVRNEGSLGHQ